MTRAHLILAAAVALAAAPARGQDDRPAETAKQKAVAAENLKKAGLDKMTATETDDLVVYSALPEARSKTQADFLQKTFEAARKELKFEAKEKLWPGKLAVVIFAEPRQFANYVRLVEQRRPDKGLTFSINTRGDSPYVLDAPDLGEKPTDAATTQDAARLVAAALLGKKAGASAALPEWLQAGFGRGMAARADGKPATFAAYRTAVKTAILGGKGKPTGVRLTDVWSGQKTKSSDLVAAGFTEFLLAGPYADKFPSFLAGFKPSDTNAEATIASVLTGLEWTTEGLEAAWQQWLLKWK